MFNSVPKYKERDTKVKKCDTFASSTRRNNYVNTFYWSNLRAFDSPESVAKFSCYLCVVKGAMSRLAYLENLSLNFSCSSFNEILSQFFKFVVRRGAGMGHWWERLPRTYVAWVRFWPGVICGLSLLLVLALPRGFFSVFFSFSSLHKNQHSKFQFDQDWGPAWKSRLMWLPL